MPESTRIAEVRVTPILISDPPLLNVQGVHQPYTPRTIVEVVTENGVSGIGETYGDTDYLTIAQAFGPELVGRPLTARNDLFARVAAAAAEVDIARIDNTVVAEGLRGARTEVKLVHSVVSAFEVALLDALGHETGLPVHALLGGKVRDRVEYSGYLFYRWAAHPLPGEPEDDWGAALDPAGVVAQARRFADRYGFRSFKLKGGAFAPEQEVAAVHALHEAFPDAPLRLDPNGAWSVETSLRVAAELEGVAEYLEDPTAGTEQMARVAARTSLPLATNMCVTALDEVPAAFAADAVQVVLSDHHYWGGLRATQDLAAICRTHGKQLSMHSNTHLGISLAAMTHVAATIPDLDHACDTHRPWQTEDVITAPHTFRDGCVEVTDAPGLGIELDRDSLARLHRRWLDSDVRDRDDAAAMRRVRPEWQAPSFPVW
ncbi:MULTISPECIES: glucarate dehydratase family protein [unclassified Saccharopolyspora]|uniref:glucarate dehydratase family protein n=1 Tax=unclassified Saccharopolyspora TaxID=2646250 RepID=UPI001CD31681|nr:MULTISPECIES: glucarate dehydratase family protein [unclassified Saccharopolyspora]MCA1191897.1 glucarate dehydratase family protein [Saccharopolyspora sp. 6V]MCA1224819.1 glucarate dehydratase family protein [Saccharopolyspora sp. 6M]MCA1280167.1 glucarate dehydratase family protein [Saccharopolyspora sp. 7B]